LSVSPPTLSIVPLRLYRNLVAQLFACGLQSIPDSLHSLGNIALESELS